mgnify:CR=1 FL=1
MINLLRPKYLFPIQGEYRELDAHARVAMEVGILPENIFIPKRGTVMEGTKRGTLSLPVASQLEML